MCRTHESISIQNKTLTQQEVSAVSTRPSRSKHLSANKQNKYVHGGKGKEINYMARSMPKIKSSVHHGEKVFHMPQTKSFLNCLQISEQAKEAIQSCQYYRPGYV